MIQRVRPSAPIGNSDHVSVLFDLRYTCKHDLDSEIEEEAWEDVPAGEPIPNFQIFNFNKAD